MTGQAGLLPGVLVAIRSRSFGVYEKWIASKFPIPPLLLARADEVIE
jgi:hypothetical protein